RGSVVAQLLGPRRADDRARDVRFPQDPNHVLLGFAIQERVLGLRRDRLRESRGRPASARPSTSSERPWRWMFAVSRKLTPASKAASTSAIAASSSRLPPKVVQVPRQISETRSSLLPSDR